MPARIILFLLMSGTSILCARLSTDFSMVVCSNQVIIGPSLLVAATLNIPDWTKPYMPTKHIVINIAKCLSNFIPGVP